MSPFPRSWWRLDPPSGRAAGASQDVRGTTGMSGGVRGCQGVALAGEGLFWLFHLFGDLGILSESALGRPYRALMLLVRRKPRALPWAIAFCPVGAPLWSGPLERSLGAAYWSGLLVRPVGAAYCSGLLQRPIAAACWCGLLQRPVEAACWCGLLNLKT